MRRPIRRAPRIGDIKQSVIPNDADHDGWLLLTPNVRMVGKVQYAELLKVICYTFGGSAAGTTFGLPPAGGKFLLGADAAHPFASTGGAETVKLTAAQMPKHSHGYDKPSLGTPENVNLIGSVLGGILRGITIPKPVVSTGQATTDAGSGEAHENMPPYLAINVFIFAGMPPG